MIWAIILFALALFASIISALLPHRYSLYAFSHYPRIHLSLDLLRNVNPLSKKSSSCVELLFCFTALQILLEKARILF